MPSSSEPIEGHGADGMRRLWLRCALFVALMLPGWVVLEWGMAGMPNSHSIKRDRLHALAGKVDTLILGSSETYYGICPHQMSGTVFNLANWSQSLYYDDQLMERALPELPKLSRVIVLVNYMSLYSELYDHPESWRQYQYLQEWGIPLQRPVDYLSTRVFSRVAVYSPHTALEALRKGFHMSLAPRVDDRGWYRVPDEDRWGLGAKEGQGRLDVHHGFMKDEHFQENTAMLERLVTVLRARGIEVVMLTTPVWSTYRAGIHHATWERAKAEFERVAQQHGARYLNFQDEPRMTAEDFEDADHLNADGAAHFAKILDATLGPVGGEADRSELEHRAPAMGG